MASSSAGGGSAGGDNEELAKFLELMDNVVPTVSLWYLAGPCSALPCNSGSCRLPQIPEEVTKYYLSKTGFDTDDRRLYDPLPQRSPSQPALVLRKHRHAHAPRRVLPSKLICGARSTH
jgi:hypothetical protein